MQQAHYVVSDVGASKQFWRQPYLTTTVHSSSVSPGLRNLFTRISGTIPASAPINSSVWVCNSETHLNLSVILWSSLVMWYNSRKMEKVPSWYPFSYAELLHLWWSVKQYVSTMPCWLPCSRSTRYRWCSTNCYIHSIIKDCFPSFLCPQNPVCSLYFCRYCTLWVTTGFPLMVHKFLITTTTQQRWSTCHDGRITTTSASGITEKHRTIPRGTSCCTVSEKLRYTQNECRRPSLSMLES